MMMMMMNMVLEIPHWPRFFLFMLLLLLVQRAAAQATTHPVDVAAFRSITAHWKITSSSSWNATGEPCSGTAIDSSTIDNTAYNPAIKCDCKHNNGTTCRITQLKVSAMSITGTIPEALANLTFLTNLNLGQNYLTGPLPSFIGNLTSMEWLTFGINALSGTVPKELGLLTSLKSLAFSSNNFSGPLPPELGNLASLEQLYIDSAGVSGAIPSTFSKLKNLQILWASDNELTGKIPEFIGNLTQLNTLRLQGTALEGPITSSFSNLTLMGDLRISELGNRTSSLSFIKNMKQLATLVLRNNMISDSIPDIGDLQKLHFLDLSFNNLTGQIPSSLFNMNMTYLFLGNNTLSGSIPSTKSSSLRNIDLSFNNLSGSFPSWLNQPSVYVNLAGNAFVIESSNSSVVPSGLNCLQQTFPCNRNPPLYAQFAIKCGGPEITSSTGIKFEKENEVLNATSYYIADSKKWAVSNNGLFISSSNPQYVMTSSSQFTNTLDSELFQTARLSPGSLRYYGLGLENGNYSVNLQFSESEIEGSLTWKSLGRRVFDIYIQGIRMQKDFDIRKQAGGVSLRAVSLDFKANVTENYLEIHLFWAGKGTCCIPSQATYGPAISAISVSPDFVPTVKNPTSKDHNSVIGLIAGITTAVGVVAIISIIVVFILLQRRKRLLASADAELSGITAKPNMFSYSELRSATNDFAEANKLGEGGFGPVYKGKLSDGRFVAVKQLSETSRQGKNQFLTEIATISAVQHRNLVKLYGCCLQGDRRLLVYEYLENKSLDHAILGNVGLCLDWPTRYQIFLGTARGLSYLHEESSIRIVHRDVKASNILLDADMNPKISDFGLAKLYDDTKTHISTRVAGTIGYLAPEYAMRGHLTEKADVFGYGVVVLEVISGRSNADQNLDKDKVYLLEWAWSLYESNSSLDIVDPSLSEYNESEALRAIGIAFLCTQASPGQRPSMSRVVAMLSGDVDVKPVTSRPVYLTDWTFDDKTGTGTGTSTSTSGSHVPTSGGTSLPYSFDTNITNLEGR